MKVTLPKSFAALSTGDFERFSQTLGDELADRIYDLISEDPEAQGGWTEDEEVLVQNIRSTHDGVTASLLFTYAYKTPSGCSDFPYSERGSYRMLLILRHGASEAELESPTENWDAADYNSAADGN
jgi:hypothetical protein